MRRSYFAESAYFGSDANEQKKQENKVTIVGVGAVGMACAFGILSQGLCSKMVLADIDKKKLDGEVNDLNHAGAFLHASVQAAGPDYKETAHSKVVIVTAGVRQRTGETRLALVGRNVEVFKHIIPPIARQSPDAILLVVSNPCDVLAWVAWKMSGFPVERVISSGTYLDTSRFRVLLSQRLAINPQSMHAFIIGEHGDSSVAVWSGVNVGGMSLSQITANCEQDMKDELSAEVQGLHEKVRNAAYEVISQKGYTNWAIGAAVATITRTILKDERRVLCVGINAKGLYGIDSDCFISVPSVLGQTGVQHVLSLDLSEMERTQLLASANTLNEVQQGIAAQVEAAIERA